MSAPLEPQRRKRVRPSPLVIPLTVASVETVQSPRRRYMEILAFDPTTKVGARVDPDKRLTLELSVPAEGDECCIGMEPIAEYRLEWLPPGIPQCVMSDAPDYTKATITGCGHGFNALALLYHFLKNEMTCPCCRHGHSRARMSWHQLPPHLRLAMRERLDRTISEERQAQADADASDVERLLLGEVQAMMGVLDEVTPVSAVAFTHMNRQTLILYAYVGEDSISPLMVQEIALDTSISSDGTLHLSSYPHSMRELARNLRLLPTRTSRFELVVASRRRGGGVLALYRSQRFAPGVSEVPIAWGVERPAQIELQWSNEANGLGITGFALSMRAGGDLGTLLAPMTNSVLIY